MDSIIEQAIRERAYAIWVEHGYADGKAHEHWVAAERQVMAEAGLGRPRHKLAQKAGASAKTVTVKAVTAKAITAKAAKAATAEAAAGNAIAAKTKQAAKPKAATSTKRAVSRADASIPAA